MTKPNGGVFLSVLPLQAELQEYTDFLNLQYLKLILNENLLSLTYITVLLWVVFQWEALHKSNGK